MSLLLSTPCEARETFEAYAVEIARVFGYECSDAAAAVSLSLKAYVTDSFDRSICFSSKILEPLVVSRKITLSRPGSIDSR